VPFLRPDADEIKVLAGGFVPDGLNSEDSPVYFAEDNRGSVLTSEVGKNCQVAEP
jgi:hypothetical protein